MKTIEDLKVVIEFLNSHFKPYTERGPFDYASFRSSKKMLSVDMFFFENKIVENVIFPLEDLQFAIVKIIMQDAMRDFVVSMSKLHKQFFDKGGLYKIKGASKNENH